MAEQGERLIATGRFCDLSGYVALNLHLDPEEEVEAVMFRLKRVATEIGGSYSDGVVMLIRRFFPLKIPDAGARIFKS